jgi:MFS family permease
MDTPVTGSAWAPLRVRAFRLLWLTQLGSMIGSWMQNVGAQWLLVSAPGAETLVAMVQATAMLPVLVLALPAGAIADILDRRRLLIGVQVFQVAVGSALVGLTVAGVLTPALLLTATFLLGCGTTVMIPGYQALVQDLVPREQLRTVAGLNGIAMNLARSIGPPIAGLLIAHADVAVVFALNAVSYVGLGVVLLGMRSPADRPNRLPERFSGALMAGARYVRHAPTVRRIVLRCLLFVAPGAALWALLPLVASKLLGLDASGYGLLLGALGLGAIAGAALLPSIGKWLSPNRQLLVSGIAFGAAAATCALVRDVAVVAAVLVPAGLAWLTVLATLNGILQTFLPVWVRARIVDLPDGLRGRAGRRVGALGNHRTAVGDRSRLADRRRAPGRGCTVRAGAPAARHGGAQPRSGRVLASAAPGVRSGTGARPGAGDPHLHHQT